ncbi:MAG TPA: O-antigen ligase family protein [Pyrinomonadaceae bacterium]
MRRDRHFTDYEPVTKGGRAKDVCEVAEESFASLHRKPDDEDVEAADSWATVVELKTDEKERVENSAVVVERLPVPRPKTREKQTAPKENWLKRRGHVLSYAGLFLFTGVLYFRPYELIPALSSFTSIAFVLAISTLLIFFPTQLALEGNLTARPREVNLLLLLCLAGLLSIPFAINPKEAWDTFNDAFIKAVLMFIVMINVVRTKWRLRGLLLLGIAVSVYLSLEALGDYQSGNLTVEGYRVSGSIGGMFGNPNDMALHLATIFPIIVALLFTTRNIFVKLGYAACGALSMAGIVVTFSRGGSLALAGALGVLCWKIGRKHRLAVMLSMFVFLGAFMALAPGSYGERLGSILDHSRDSFGSANMRQQVLIRSIIVAAKHPLFGIGMGNFHTVSIRELVSHNAYTQVAAEMGLAAMIVYILFMLTPFKRLREIERETLDTRQSSRFYYMSIGLQASIVAYMIGSFFASVAYHWYVYYLVGYSICLRRMYQLDEEAVKIVEGEAPTAKVEERAERVAVLPEAEAVLR